MEEKELRFYVDNPITADREELLGIVDTNGNFELQGEILQFQEIAMAFEHWRPLFVAPGAHVHFTFDARDESGTIQFARDLAHLNTELQLWDKAEKQFWIEEYRGKDYRDAIRIRFDLYKDLRKGAFKTHTDYFYELGGTRLSHLDEFRSVHPLSDTVYNFVKNGIFGSILNEWGRYKGTSVKDSLAYFHEKLVSRFPLGAVQLITGGIQIDLNNYSYALFRLESDNFFRKSHRDQLKYFLEEDAPQLTEDQKTKIQLILNQDPDKMLEEATMLRDLLYKEYPEFLTNKNMVSFNLNQFMVFDKYFERPAREILYTRILGGLLNEQALDHFDELWPVYKQKNQNKIFEQALWESYSSIKQRLASGESAAGIVLNDFPEEGITDMVGYLAEKYPNKVLYVDVWATWCGPCISQFPDSKKLKKRMTGEDVVFVYLSASSSNLKQWKDMISIKELQGEHYFMDEASYKAFLTAFDIRGIPRYLLIDKKGIVADENAARPRMAEKKIRKLLRAD